MTAPQAWFLIENFHFWPRNGHFTFGFLVEKCMPDPEMARLPLFYSTTVRFWPRNGHVSFVYRENVHVWPRNCQLTLVYHDNVHSWPRNDGGTCMAVIQIPIVRVNWYSRAMLIRILNVSAGGVPKWRRLGRLFSFPIQKIWSELKIWPEAPAPKPQKSVVKIKFHLKIYFFEFLRPFRLSN